MRIVVLIIVVFIALSCTKFGKNVTIKGRVLNPITGEGIADAEIWLQKTTIGLPGGLKTVKKATSSSDGSFELDKFHLLETEIKHDLAKGYYMLVIQKESLWHSEKIIVSE